MCASYAKQGSSVVVMHIQACSQTRCSVCWWYCQRNRQGSCGASLPHVDQHKFGGSVRNRRITRICSVTPQDRRRATLKRPLYRFTSTRTSQSPLVCHPCRWARKTLARPGVRPQPSPRTRDAPSASRFGNGSPSIMQIGKMATRAVRPQFNLISEWNRC